MQFVHFRGIFKVDNGNKAKRHTIERRFLKMFGILYLFLNDHKSKTFYWYFIAINSNDATHVYGDHSSNDSKIKIVQVKLPQSVFQAVNM